MKYFTPKLWIAFQGPRRNAACRVWDHRFQQYQENLKRILPMLRPMARRFFRDAMILHDGTLTRMELGDDINDIAGRWSRRDIINRRKIRVRFFVLADVVERRRIIGNCWYVLEYNRVKRVDVNFPGKLELFPAGFESNFGDWGYDELTCPEKGLFRHEILFSSGATIKIDFHDFSFRRKTAKAHKTLHESRP